MAKPETASRIRERIEQVLDSAKVRGYRDSENPARWRGHLENFLPSPSKVRRVKHHPALPYGEIGEFMVTLRERIGVSAAALDSAILTAARTGVRMKALRDHRVPLSRDAMKLLKRMNKVKHDNFVFPGGKAGKPLSNMAPPDAPKTDEAHRHYCSRLSPHIPRLDGRAN